MPDTLATVYTHHKIKHIIDNESPIFSLPLFLIYKEELPDLLCIISILENKFVDGLPFPAPVRKNWGEYSLKKAEEFYEQLKLQVIAAMKNKKVSSTIDPKLITIEPKSIPKDPLATNIATKINVTVWLSSRVLTDLMSTQRIYKVMSAYLTCPDDISFFVNIISNVEQTPEQIRFMQRHLKHLKLNNLYENHVKVVATAVVAVDLFNKEKNPQLFIYQYIKNLRKSNNSLNLYLIDVLTLVANEVPPTLRSLLFKAGFDMNVLNPSIKALEEPFNKNLNKVPELSSNQWPVLIFYFLLFISRRAKADKNLAIYTYAGKKHPTAIKIIAERKANFLKSFIENSQYLELLSANFLQSIIDEIDLSFPNMHACLLALICFESFPPLKNLFMSVWKFKSDFTYAIYPSSNPFYFGTLYCPNKGQPPLSISSNDLYQVVLLMNIAKKMKSNPDTTNQVEFQNEKTKIEDDELRESLTLTVVTKQATHFTGSSLINYDALYEFLITFVLNANGPNHNKFEQFKTFFNVLREQTDLDKVLSKLKPSDFINLGSIPELNLKKESIMSSQDTIRQKIGALPLLADDKEQSIERQWLETKYKILGCLSDQLEIQLFKEPDEEEHDLLCNL